MDQIDAGIPSEPISFTATILNGDTDPLPEMDAPERVDVYPWGKKWFLPRHTITDASVSWSTADERLDMSASGDSQVHLDKRIHARLLRWAWINVRIPVAQWWNARQKENEK